MRDVLELGPVGPPPPMTSRAALGVVTSLFRRLHAEGLVYCHWKSNEHLEASLRGETDFDLLVDPRDALTLSEIFSQLNIKRFVVAPFHGYPGVEDYVACDPDTGRLIHLHIHYQLTVGEKLLNGYRLPWEHQVLSTRVLDAQHEIYVADPHVELVLLVTRAALKLRARDLVLGTLRRTYFQYKVLKEFSWLVDRIDRERLREVGRRLVGSRAADLLVDMVGAPPAKRRLLAFRRRCEPSLRTHRSYGAWGARLRRWLREARTLWWWMENRYFGVPKNSSRTRPQGGAIIAILADDASDGNGSRIARAAGEWLAEEVAVVPINAATRVPVRAWRARSLGKIVIAEGWPVIEASRPDVIVKLHTATGVETPWYPPSTRVVDIDARRPVERVLFEVKHAIWQNL